LVAIAAEAQQGRGQKGVDFSDPIVSGLVQLAAHVAVQKELGLSGETTSKINALHENYLAAKREALDAAKRPTGDQIAQGLSREEMHKYRQQLADLNSRLENEFTPKLK